MATHKALVLHKFGEALVYQDFPKPAPKEGELLVKVDATTINPSDRGRISGVYSPTALNKTMGLEGCGHVVEVNGENLQHWIGKRVCFIQAGSGSWGEYALTTPHLSFDIEEDVPLACAASGIVNPLTVVGMIDIYNKTPDKKGIIHTAAASALGRMLNKYCLTLGVPLLNIVRREEQAELLKSEGAKHVLITNGDWQAEYAEIVKEHGFNILFDALGGGPILKTLISKLQQNSWVHLYGYLQGKPLQIDSTLDLRGIYITHYRLFAWYDKLPAEDDQIIRKEYSKLLKGDLSTQCYKVLKYEQISEALELSVSKATEGKITLVPK